MIHYAIPIICRCWRPVARPPAARRLPVCSSNRTFARAWPQSAKSPSFENEVRYFDQEGPSAEDLVEIDGGDEAKHRAQLKRLEQEEQDVEDEFINDLRETTAELADEEARQRQRGVNTRDFAAEIDELRQLVEKPLRKKVPSANELQVQFELPRALRTSLTAFNEALRGAASFEEEGSTDHQLLASELWLRYLRCKRMVPSFVKQIPPAAWQCLWDLHYDLPLDNEDRSKRLWQLTADMTEAGASLTTIQRMVRIESVLAGSDSARAFSLWRSEHDRLDAGGELAQEHRELGIRCAVAAEDLEAAQFLALQTPETQENYAAQHYARVIAARAQKGDEGNMKLAWSLYLRMREGLAATVTLEDLDHVVMAFMRSGQLNLALAVFKDLVLLGRGSTYDSVQLAHKALELHGALQKQAGGLNDLTTLSLTALAHLPRRFENRYFYGSWMKRLIGMGEVNAAMAVLQLMYERGRRPDALHVNGIMGAWLRGDDPYFHELAIQVGWTMIRERLRFVAKRRAEETGVRHDPPSVPSSRSRVPVPEFMATNLPSATIETFSILLLYFERRDMHTTARELERLLDSAEIMPNSYFMNHLLYSMLRRSDVAGAWQYFEHKSKAIAPDLESFAALWDCERSRLGNFGLCAPKAFPLPRALFSRMMNWFGQLAPRDRTRARESFTRGLYQQILHCISIRRDLEGTVVALFALRQSFDMGPDPSTIQTIAMQLCHLGEEKPSRTKGGRQRSRAAPETRFRKEKQRVMRIIELIGQQREEALKAHNIDAGALTEEQTQDESLYRLALLLRIFMLHKETATAAEEQMLNDQIEQTAWEMGTGGFDLRDPLLKWASSENAGAAEDSMPEGTLPIDFTS